jgi:hypothetical protein
MAASAISYDNALAETINDLYKAEVIHRQSWKNPIGDIPPAEAEIAYYRQQDTLAAAALLTPTGLQETRGGSRLLSSSVSYLIPDFSSLPEGGGRKMGER